MQIVSQMLPCINVFFDYMSECLLAVAETLRKCGTFQIYSFYTTLHYTTLQDTHMFTHTQHVYIMNGRMVLTIPALKL